VFAATGASAASARREPASVMAIYLTVAPPGKWASECDNVGRMVRPGKAKRMTVAYDILRLPRLARPLRAVALALLALLLLPYVITPIYAVVEPVSTVMLWRRMTGEPVARTYVPLSHISPNLMRAVIVAEDGRFCRHYGVDLAEIRDAIKEADDLDDMRGGSTITQQVAKNLFLWPGRSYLRKALEFPLALWIDLVLSKRRILEIYLNIAEWGPSSSGPRPAAGTPSASRPAVCHITRRRCWRRCCPIRMIATRTGRARACDAWLASMSPAPAARPAPRLACAEPPSLGRNHPL
jgi:monofunctional biosynthetic peptidoglycan transglycosylase